MGTGQSLPVDVRPQDRLVPPERTAEEMIPLVEQYNEPNGQSAAAFCAVHGISYGQLNYCRRKYR